MGTVTRTVIPGGEAAWAKGQSFGAPSSLEWRLRTRLESCQRDMRFMLMPYDY